MPESPRPEDAYKATTDRAERRRLQAKVVELYRLRVVALAHRAVPREYWREAEQVGLIGLLVALEKFDPEGKHDFWYLASTAVRDEIRTWRDTGIYWRKDTNRGKSPARVAARQEAQRQGQHESADTTRDRGSDLGSISIKDAYFDSSAPTPEDLYANEEARRLCAAFLSTLNDEDRAALFAPKNPRHRSLIERARAFVRGSDDEWTSKRCTRPSKPVSA